MTEVEGMRRGRDRRRGGRCSWPCSGWSASGPIDGLNDVDRPVDGLAAALVLVAGLGTAFRRVRAVPGAVVVGAATATYLTIGYPYGPVMFCLALAVYSLARETRWCPPRAGPRSC